MSDVFKASQFVATKWSTADDKARFANHFVNFVEEGFPSSLFYLWFYKELSDCFGHIAHYDRAGFFGTFFSDEEGKVDFLKVCLEYPCYGSPKHTFCDVEIVLQDWLRENHVLDTQEDIAKEMLDQADWEQYQHLQKKFAGRTE